MTSLVHPDDSVTIWAFLAAGTAAAIWIEQRYRWAARLSGPVVGLLIAMLLSNTGVLPTDSPAYDFVYAWIIPLAIPLLLFRANLREIIGGSGRLFLIFHISAIGTLAGTALAVLLLGGAIGSPNGAHAAGMMSGSYMGGGVNFAAVAASYEVDEKTVTAPLTVADNFVMVIGFLALFGMAASAWFRARYPHPHSRDLESGSSRNLATEHWTRKGISLLDIAKALAFAFGVFALASALRTGLQGLFGDTGSASLAWQVFAVFCTNQFVLLTLISLVLASLFARPLREVNGPEEFGAYLLYVFLFMIGLPANLLLLIREAPIFLPFCALIVGTNIGFTLLVGRLLRLNLEELVVAVNANLGGPPSAAAMAISAGWPRLILPGILVGIWGYVLGTPIGILVVELLNR